MIKVNQKALKNLHRLVEDLESGIFEKSVRSLAQDSIDKVKEAFDTKNLESLIPNSKVRKIGSVRQMKKELFKSVVSAMARRFNKKIMSDSLTEDQIQTITKVFKESVVEIQDLIRGR